MKVLDWLGQDLRYGLRSLKKERRFALLAMCALALGIGSTTVIFSVIYNGVLAPFPYRAPERLTNFFIHDVSQPKDDGRPVFSLPEFFDYKQQNHVFEDMIGVEPLDILYTKGEGTLQFDGAQVSPNTFEFLGVRPLLGRPITPQDGQPGSPPVFAMNYKMWRSQFNGDPKLLGTTLTLNGEPRTLVAVMPPRFQFWGVDLWIPHAFSRNDPATVEGRPRYLWAMGRRKPGISLQAAAADLQVLAHGLAKIYPKEYPKSFTVITKSLADTVVQDFKTMLYILIGAVLMLLLISCSNVANLLLARATAREKEIAIRSSMGATRGRLVRQLLVESFVLAAGGGVAGCFLAYGALRWIAASVPDHSWLPAEAVLTVNSAALLFAVAATLITTLLCGLAPAWHAVRGDLYPRLKDTGMGSNAAFRHAHFRSALVIAEVALSMVLLVGAGLMMRSFLALTHVSLGFNPQQILVARLPLPRGRYETAEQKRLFFQELLRRVDALPGVIAATETSSLPPYGGMGSEVDVPGKSHAERWDTLVQLCSEGYFATLGRPLVLGRLLSPSEVDSGRDVAVINQTLAHKFFGRENPIGQKIKFKRFDDLPEGPKNAYFDIIGVVADAKNRGLQEDVMPEAFIPYTVTGEGERGILVRTAMDPDAMLASVRRVVWSVDHNVALTLTGSLEYYLRRFSYSQPEFGLVSLGIFAAIGLVLVIIGVFSVMAYSVSLQTRDIGIRMALGAERGTILNMVLRKGLGLVGTGMGIGLLASFGLTRLMASQIWGVSATDPWTFSGVVAVVLGVGVVACIVPARRATEVDPLIALRYE